MRNETVRGILCQETTLFDRIAEQRLNWFGHVARMGSERLPAKALHCYIDGKRNQGRQPKKWMDKLVVEVARDAQCCIHTLDTSCRGQTHRWMDRHCATIRASLACASWANKVNEDIEAKKLTVQQAMVLVWDRNKWKHQVAASSSLKWWQRAEEKRESNQRWLLTLYVSRLVHKHIASFTFHTKLNTELVWAAYDVYSALTAQ